MKRIIVLIGFVLASTMARAADPDFVRDIRPILIEKCYACHGPDEEKRKSDLRFEPGRPDKSPRPLADKDYSGILDDVSC